MTCVTQNAMNLAIPYYVVCLISDCEILLNPTLRYRIPVVRFQFHAVAGLKLVILARSTRIPLLPQLLIRSHIIHHLSVRLVREPKQPQKQYPCKYHYSKGKNSNHKFLQPVILIAISELDCRACNHDKVAQAD